MMFSNPESSWKNKIKGTEVCHFWLFKHEPDCNVYIDTEHPFTV